MKVYRIIFSDEPNTNWMEDPRLAVKSFKPNDSNIYHFPGSDNISSIVNAKLYLFDAGYSKEQINYVIQMFDDRLGFWDIIFESKINQGKIREQALGNLN